MPLIADDIFDQADWMLDLRSNQSASTVAALRVTTWVRHGQKEMRAGDP